MSGVALNAYFTLAAAGIDLSYHSASNEANVGRFDDSAYKLVAKRPAESCITLHYFEVGVADARADHLNERFAFAARNWCIAHEFEGAVKPESFHLRFPSRRE